MKQGRTVLQAKRYGVQTCTASATLLQAAQIMEDQEINTMVVINEAGHLLGIISRSDVVRAVVTHQDWGEQGVEQCMSTHVLTVTPQTTLHDAARLMVNNHVHQVVVIGGDSGREPMAVLSIGDLVHDVMRSEREQNLALAS